MLPKMKELAWQSQHSLFAYPKNNLAINLAEANLDWVNLSECRSKEIVLSMRRPALNYLLLLSLLAPAPSCFGDEAPLKPGENTAGQHCSKEREAKSGGKCIKKDNPEDEKEWDEFLEASRKSYTEGKLNDAANQLDLALAASERLKSDGARAEAFARLGEQYLYLKQYEKAKTLMEEGLSLKRKIPGFKSLTSANAMDNLAQAYSRLGNFEAACKFEQEALGTYESLRKTKTPDYAIGLSNHANTLRQLKKYSQAEQAFAKAVAVQQDLDNKTDSLDLAKILLNAGGLYCDMNKLDSAKRLLDRASKIIHSKLGPEHPLYKLSLKSERVLWKKRVDSLLKKDPNPVRPEVAQAVLHLAGLYDAEGDPAQAVAAYKQGLSIQEKLLPADSPDLKKIRDDYAACAKKL